MGVHKFYEVTKEGKLKRKRSVCPRCGAGTFLAEHKGRYTCGKCFYTKFVKK